MKAAALVGITLAIALGACAYLLFGAAGVVALVLANAAFVVGVCLGRRIGIDEALEHVQKQLVEETKRAIDAKLQGRRGRCTCREEDTVAVRSRRHGDAR